MQLKQLKNMALLKDFFYRLGVFFHAIPGAAVVMIRYHRKYHLDDAYEIPEKLNIETRTCFDNI
jgi:hypothetical protein